MFHEPELFAGQDVTVYMGKVDLMTDQTGRRAAEPGDGRARPLLYSSLCALVLGALLLAQPLRAEIDFGPHPPEEQIEESIEEGGQMDSENRNCIKSQV